MAGEAAWLGSWENSGALLAPNTLWTRSAVAQYLFVSRHDDWLRRNRPCGRDDWPWRSSGKPISVVWSTGRMTGHHPLSVLGVAGPSRCPGRRAERIRAGSLSSLLSERDTATVLLPSPNPAHLPRKRGCCHVLQHHRPAAWSRHQKSRHPSLTTTKSCKALPGSEESVSRLHCLPCPQDQVHRRCAPVQALRDHRPGLHLHPASQRPSQEVGQIQPETLTTPGHI